MAAEPIVCVEPEARSSATGRVDIGFSAVTGKELRYFTPEPLSDLLRRASCPGRVDPQLAVPRATPLLLIRAASIHGLKRKPDPAQAQRFGEMLLGYNNYRTAAEHIGLGAQVCRRSIGLRQEIAFAGSANASTAAHIFAPHDLLPELMKSLDQVMRNPPPLNPTDVASLVGFYCTLVHPFPDGNGRFARLLSLQAAIDLGSPLSGMISAVFQAACRNELADRIWPEMMLDGPAQYLRAATLFEKTLGMMLVQRNLLQESSEVVSALKGRGRNNREFSCVAVALFASGAISTALVRTQFGMSKKAMVGLQDTIRRTAGDSAEADSSSIGVNDLVLRVDDAVRAAKEATLEECL